MALTTFKKITYEGKDWDSLMGEISGVLRDNIVASTTFRGCVPVEAKISKGGAQAWDLCSKDFSVFATSWKKKVRKLINVDHRNIYLCYVPRILRSTSCSDSCFLLNKATLEKIPLGVFPLNEMFFVRTGWPRSLMTKDVIDGKGLCLTHQIIAPTLPVGCSAGRWLPFWEEDFGLKMTYQKDVPITFKTKSESLVKDAISEAVRDSLMAGLVQNSSQVLLSDSKLLSPIPGNSPEVLIDFTTQKSEANEDVGSTLPRVLLQSNGASVVESVVEGRGTGNSAQTPL
ncbi:movement protein [Lilac ring mottle virus]|uniref:Movement protein n=2 Tax=Lilac ring mottle virus TaxID=37125 RepID=Q83068_9BROM|nr:movement protein [Lilac ring mottle virus]AAA64839.1 movement protein [Lilac ring mottle virus]prf//2116346A movement protein [Lilac ring mottle virus]